MIWSHDGIFWKDHGDGDGQVNSGFVFGIGM